MQCHIQLCILYASANLQATVLRDLQLHLQLQSLMLQMAANAAAPSGRPSRTAETNTSMLWAPSAPLLPPQHAGLLPAGLKPDSEQAQQKHEQNVLCQSDRSPAQSRDLHTQPEAQLDHRPNDERNQLSPQHAQLVAQQEYQQAEQLVEANDSSAAASVSAVASNGSSQARPESTASEDKPDSGQQAKQASHNDAHQPWASCWLQPALPALAVPVTQRASYTAAVGQQGQQQRRVTASDVPHARMLQQQAARKSSGLQAARSLSWGQSAEDQALAKLRSSGEACCLWCQHLIAGTLSACMCLRLEAHMSTKMSEKQLTPELMHVLHKFAQHVGLHLHLVASPHMAAWNSSIVF